MYGGRVIDDFDRRITRTYMNEYMGDFLFDTFQPFHFYKDDNVDYCLPEEDVVQKEEFIGELILRVDPISFTLFLNLTKILLIELVLINWL